MTANFCKQKKGLRVVNFKMAIQILSSLLCETTKSSLSDQKLNLQAKFKMRCACCIMCIIFFKLFSPLQDFVNVPSIPGLPQSVSQGQNNKTFAPA